MALLRMELHARNVVFRDDRRDGLAVVTDAHDHFRSVGRR